MKLKTSWAVRLGIVFFMMMVYGWILFPSHTIPEWKQFLEDVSVFIFGVAILGFGLWRMKIIKDRAAAEEAHRDMVREKIIDHQEMKENAEKALTEDRKAHLRMLRNNPHYKIDIKV